MNCHSEAGHRLQAHQLQSGNIMAQFMTPSISEEEPPEGVDGVVTMLQTGRSRVRIPVEERDFSVL
jgi:hypothetical protein